MNFVIFLGVYNPYSVRANHADALPSIEKRNLDHIRASNSTGEIH